MIRVDRRVNLKSLRGGRCPKQLPIKQNGVKEREICAGMSAWHAQPFQRGIRIPHAPKSRRYCDVRNACSVRCGAFQCYELRRYFPLVICSKQHDRCSLCVSYGRELCNGKPRIALSRVAKAVEQVASAFLRDQCIAVTFTERDGRRVVRHALGKRPAPG